LQTDYLHDFLSLTDRRLAYQRLPGRGPGVVFLGGYASDMTGSKASFLAECCKSNNRAFLRFDYSGHGQSEGDFKNGTIGAWFQDSLAVFDQLTEGPQIVVGSSMGGWLGLMLCMQRPERIKAFIGVAAAPDFTETLMWEMFSDKQREQLRRDGVIYDENAPPEERAPITLRLIEEARQHLMLTAPIPLDCPVRLLQGMQDRDVPWTYASHIADAITGENIRVTLIKDGNHRLSREQDLALLWQAVEEFTD
jgi:pimeloyl-ACP methyl ester carboxylesterase